MTILSFVEVKTLKPTIQWESSSIIFTDEINVNKFKERLKKMDEDLLIEKLIF